MNSIVNTHYKITLSYWEACVLERLINLTQEIMLDQIGSPADFIFRLCELRDEVEELKEEFDRDREADKNSPC